MSRPEPLTAAAAPGNSADLANRVRAFGAAVSRRLPNFRGKERAVRAFEACLRRVAPNRQVLRASVGGVRYALQTDDLIDYHIAYLSSYAGGVITYLDSVIGDRHTVLWDVGANVRAVSLPLARRHPELAIEAFEPSPAVITRLRRNLALNADLAARIRLHEIALCDRVGSVDFYPSAETANGGVGTLMPGANTERTPVRVTAQAGDAFIEAGAARPPDVLKIDVEGFEYEVLYGLRQHLARRRDLVVVFEHEPYRLRGRAESGKTIELLSDMGFILFGLTRGGEIAPLRTAMLERHVDIVARGPQAMLRTDGSHR